ncbi:MAG: hypothetical protein H6738_19065 [Alphaproteobacteria bacterium]|nr:hypothetical protein [Alphaproteobacteria bacterium]MCB9698890.1 hypothetical protein [Alphaproteobacteria bacterium]
MWLPPPAKTIKTRWIVAFALLNGSANISQAKPGASDATAPPPTVSWADGRVVLQGVPGSARLRHEVMLAGRSARWTSEARLGVDGQALVPLVVPPAACVHPECRRFLSDLRTTVTFADGSTAAGPPQFVVWPDGPSGGALVLSEEDQVTVAPNGVLDANLREGLDDPSIILVPDLGGPPATGRGPEADAGWVTP